MALIFNAVIYNVGLFRLVITVLYDAVSFDELFRIRLYRLVAHVFGNASTEARTIISFGIPDVRKHRKREPLNSP